MTPVGLNEVEFPFRTSRFEIVFFDLLNKMFTGDFLCSRIKEAQAELDILEDELKERQGALDSLKSSLRKKCFRFNSFKEKKEKQLDRLILPVARQAVERNDVSRLSRLLKLRDAFIEFGAQREKSLAEEATSVGDQENAFSLYRYQANQKREELFSMVYKSREFFCREVGFSVGLTGALFSGQFTFPQAHYLYHRVPEPGNQFLILKKWRPEWSVIKLIQLGVLVELASEERTECRNRNKKRKAEDQVIIDFNLSETDLGKLILEAEESQQWTVLDEWLSEKTSVNSFFQTPEAIWYLEFQQKYKREPLSKKLQEWLSVTFGEVVL